MSEIEKYKKYLNFKANPRYLTRDFIVPLYTGTEPDILDDSDTQRESSVYKEFPNDMPIVSPKKIQNQPYEQLQLADGGRANFSEGSKLTGTDKTLEQNIKSDHKAFNDYRKSIGSPTIPLDNEYIRMWIRTRLNKGGSVNFSKVPQLVSSIGDNTRQEYGGERYNIKKVPNENYLYTFETKGGEKKYLMRVSKAGYNSKKTLPFTSQGKKEALKFRNEFLKDLATKTEGEVLDPSIKKLSDGRFRYRRPNKKIEYFNTKKEAEDFRKFILQNKAKRQTIKLTGGFINNVRKGINEGKSQNQLADELGVNVKKISKAIQEGNIKLPKNIVDNLEYRSFVKKNYKDKTTETIAKELFTDKKIPLSTKKSRVHNIIGTLIADGELEPIAASSKSEIRDRYGFGKSSKYEIDKATRERRDSLISKTSGPSTEYQIRQLKMGEGPQLAHRLGLEESAKLGQQYDIGNLGIDPPKINQEIAKSFENIKRRTCR
jgi:hypothetical protein